jgi:hypothetical protein
METGGTRVLYRSLIVVGVLVLLLWCVGSQPTCVWLAGTNG